MDVMASNNKLFNFVTDLPNITHTIKAQCNLQDRRNGKFSSHPDPLNFLFNSTCYPLKCSVVDNFFNKKK